MSAKKKSHGVLFTPYLQKGEDLIWVGSPEKNSFISLRPKSDIIAYWIVALIPFLFVITVLAISGTPIPSWLSSWGLYLGILWLISSLFFGFVHVGKSYYAITTKRLLILRQNLWTSLDADLLMLLPEHHLQNQPHKIVSIRFEPLRIDEVHHPAKYFREASVELVEIHRSNLENLSQEDAETANELLTAVKNDMLDERARQLGLMD
jgi:hypothetical protein